MRIYISYVPSERKRVEPVFDLLVLGNHEPMLRPAVPKDEAPKALFQSIESCKGFLFAVTKETLNNKLCKWELAQAINRQKHIILVLFDPVNLPLALGRFRSFDFSNGLSPREVARLVGNLWAISHSEVAVASDFEVLIEPNPLDSSEYPAIDPQNATKLREIMTLDPQSRFLSDIAFTRDGKLLISAHSNDSLKVWDASNGELIKILGQRDGQFWVGDYGALSFSPDGNYLAVGDATVSLWKIPEWYKFTDLFDGGAPFVFAPDNRYIACVEYVDDSETEVIVLIDTKTEAISKVFPGHSGGINTITDLTFSPDGKFLFSCGEDETLRVWDIATGKLIQSQNRHGESRIQCVSVSPDGILLATGGYDDQRAILTPVSEVFADRKIGVYTPLDHGSGVYTVAFSPNNALLASGAADGTVKIWRMRKGQLLNTLPHDGWIKKVVFSPDGTRLAAASGGSGTIKIWAV